MGSSITGVAMNALEISGLKKTYQGGVEALKGIDLTVKQGDFFACCIPTGGNPPPSA
jgi:ABC-2 type transport system ATP-binding protein